MSSQLEIGQVDIASIVIDVSSRDDIPLMLFGLQQNLWNKLFAQFFRKSFVLKTGVHFPTDINLRCDEGIDPLMCYLASKLWTAQLTPA